MMMYRVFVIGVLLIKTSFALAQDKGVTYSIAMLSQEQVNVTKMPEVADFVEEGDTSFSVYKNCSVSFRTYFVNGPQYDNIFNPNPTGIYLNNQHFVFYCGIEMAIRQNFSNVLDVKEFNFLGKDYLMLINFREDCEGEGCRYRCYNVFDVTKPDKITQVSFSSIFEGVETFGEFNSDGVIDFLRIAPKPDRDNGDPNKQNYLVTAYTIPKHTAVQLTNKEGHAYYLYVQGDEEAKKFQVIQADWFFTVKDAEGKAAPTTSYFAPYISFDPFYRYLYSPEGVRMEKNRYSVFIEDLGDLDAAKEYCGRIRERKYGEPYIMIDQYNGDIRYQVFVGNYVTKDMANKNLQLLTQNGMKGKVVDLRNDY